MNLTQKIVHSFVAALSVTLSFGVFAHDTHVDKAYATATSHTVGTFADADQQLIQRPVEDMRGGQHAHTNYNPLRSTLRNSFTYQSPSIGPRRDSHHKELLRTLEIGGRHAFDNVNLPIIT